MIASPADGAGTITADLQQTGATVTGSLVLSQTGLPDAAGTFSGTVESTGGASTLRYTAFYDYHDGCTGTYQGSLNVSGSVLSGTYIGQNCAHSFTGTMRIEKSQERSRRLAAEPEAETLDVASGLGLLQRVDVAGD